MCKNCKATDEAQARYTEIDAAGVAYRQNSTPANRERLRAANNAVHNIHNDYVFAQARKANEEARARGIQPLYITHADKQPDSQSNATPTHNLSMNRIVAVAPWGDTYTAQDAEDGCVPSEAWEVEGVEE